MYKEKSEWEKKYEAEKIEKEKKEIARVQTLLPELANFKPEGIDINRYRYKIKKLPFKGIELSENQIILMIFWENKEFESNKHKSANRTNFTKRRFIDLILKINKKELVKLDELEDFVNFTELFLYKAIEECEKMELGLAKEKISSYYRLLKNYIQEAKRFKNTNEKDFLKYTYASAEKIDIIINEFEINFPDLEDSTEIVKWRIDYIKRFVQKTGAYRRFTKEIEDLTSKQIMISQEFGISEGEMPDLKDFISNATKHDMLMNQLRIKK